MGALSVECACLDDLTNGVSVISHGPILLEGGEGGHLKRWVMLQMADQSAMCAINRLLLNVGTPQMHATEKPKKFDLNPLLNLQLLPYDTD